MFKTLLNWLFGRRAPTPAPQPVTQAAGFEKLNRQAPLRAGPPAPASAEATAAAQEIGATFICREAVLNRKQKIAGYQFLLQEAARNHIRSSTRRLHHLYAEVLVNSLIHADIGKLLGPRSAFIDVPDSFIDHECVLHLPAANTVLVLTSLPDAGAPAPDALLATVRHLRAIGYRIGLPDPESEPSFAELLPEADVVIVRAPRLTAEAALALTASVVEHAPRATLLVRELPGLEDFNFCFKLGASLFQGPFITSREDWKDHNLGPNFTRLAMLAGKLRKQAETDEIVALLKQDAALAVRLLRYINSAANGLSEHVSSIERALILLGRDKLYRWVMLLMCSTDDKEGRASAVLETALVRARMMELSGARLSAAERESLFLTGLLSLIDVVLKVPMERAMTSLAVASEIEAAIMRSEGPYAPQLMLAQACERADAEAIRSAAERSQTTPEEAAGFHLQALAWALEIQQAGA
ncbi:MAG: HDOD domain-containing protein [Azoarcus sp. PHD]|nr:MAG: HDOD domain-containing protein [Azoarcus sp. PHD]